MYVEVKSTVGSEISFMISEGELSFAEHHAKTYEIILVSSVMSDAERKIYRLTNLFCYADGEDRFRNSKFNLSGDSYTVRCIQEHTK